MKRAVILAGGTGTRLAPLTVVFPKPLMPLDETPILEVVLKQLRRSGFDSATLTVGYLAELIQTYFTDGSRIGLPLDYVREERPLGTAGAIGLVDGLTEPFLMMNGDVLTTLDYGAFLDDHAASGAALTISTNRREQQVEFGVILTEDDGRVTGYVEKPTTEYLVSMGIYALSPAVLPYIEPGVRLDLPDLVLRLIEAGEHVRSVPFDGYWLDIGRHLDYEQARKEFEARKAEFLGEDA